MLAYLEEADEYKLQVVYHNPQNAIYEIYPQIHEGFVHLSALQAYLNIADKFNKSYIYIYIYVTKQPPIQGEGCIIISELYLSNSHY